VSDQPSIFLDLKLQHRMFMRRISSVKRAVATLRTTLRRVNVAARNMLKGVQQSLQQTASFARNMLLVGGGAIWSFLRAARDFEEFGAKFKQVFGSMNDEARKWVTEQARVLQRSETDLIKYMAMLQDTFVPLGFARREAMALSKQITKLGVDLASFDNIADNVAIELLTSAIVGNHRAVRRFGIVLTQNTLEQALWQRGIKGGIKQATELEKAMARVEIIMHMSRDAQGDAVRTAHQFANQLKGLWADVKNFAIAMGNVLIPTVKEYITEVRKHIPDAIAWVKTNGDMILSTVKWTGAIAASVVALNMLLPVMKGVYVASVALGLSNPAIAGLAAIAAAATFAHLAVKKLEAAMEASAEESKRWANAWKRMKDAQKAAADAANPAAELAALKREKSAKEELLQIEESRIEAEKRRLAALENEKKMRSKAGAAAWKQEIADVAAGIPAMEKKAATFREEMHVLDKAIGRAESRLGRFTEKTDEGTPKLDAFIAALEKEVDLLSRTGAEARLVSAGITELTTEQLRYVEGLVAEIDAHEQAKSAADRAYDAKKKNSQQTIAFLDKQIELLRQIDTLTGKITPTEARREELADQGLSIQQIDKRITLEKELAALQDAQHEKQQARSVAGSFASLTGLHRSMSEAAAKIGYENKRTAAAQTAGGGSQSPVKKTEANTGLTAKGIERLVAICERVERGLPLVGAFGA